MQSFTALPKIVRICLLAAQVPHAADMLGGKRIVRLTMDFPSLLARTELSLNFLWKLKILLITMSQCKKNGTQPTMIRL